LARDLASIEPGKLANLAVLSKNPLDDIHNSNAIRYPLTIIYAEHWSWLWRPDHVQLLPPHMSLPIPAQSSGFRPSQSADVAAYASVESSSWRMEHV